MAIPVFSTRFIATTNIQPAPSYVVPAGYRAVVRCMTFGPAPGANVTFFAKINGVVVFYSGSLLGTSVDTAEWQGRVVLNAGESLVLSSSLPLNGYAGGYLLTV